MVSACKQVYVIHTSTPTAAFHAVKSVKAKTSLSLKNRLRIDGFWGVCSNIANAQKQAAQRWFFFVFAS
jgi:hypothetical protein